MQTINIHQAKTQLSKLLQQVVEGEDVIIAKAGNPIARVTAYKEEKKPRIIGLLKGKISVPNNFNDEDEEINKMFYGE